MNLGFEYQISRVVVVVKKYTDGLFIISHFLINFFFFITFVVETAFSISNLDLRVGHSTDVNEAVLCDTADWRTTDNFNRVTLWCLRGTRGKFIFITQSTDPVDANLLMTEIITY